MAKIDDAQAILGALGLPQAQQNEISGYTLLALCGIDENEPWSGCKRESKTITKGIMDWLRYTYNKPYAPNTRETFRRQVLHQFVQARLCDYNPDIPDLPTNSPRAHYKLTSEAVAVINTYGTARWSSAVQAWNERVGRLVDAYERARDFHAIPLRLPDGTEFRLSPGKHNAVQAAIVNSFAPIFAHDAVLVYLGDTADKLLFLKEETLAGLGIELNHDKLPDVVLYDEGRKWVYLIEAVTSHGPMTPKRVFELRQMFSGCDCGLIFVSAFPDVSEFRKHMKNIAWETEIWLADTPEHMIHFNGDRFFGPRR
jgi:type II restriction enzyme